MHESAWSGASCATCGKKKRDHRTIETQSVVSTDTMSPETMRKNTAGGPESNKILIQREIQRLENAINQGSEPDKDTHILRQASNQTHSKPKRAESLVKDHETAASLSATEMVDRCGRELVETEKTYVRGLKHLSDVFQRRLEMMVGTENELLTYDEIKSVFHNTRLIYNTHKGMYSDIKAHVNNGPGVGDLFTYLGETLKEYVPYFRLYADYVTGYDHAVTTLATLKADRKGFEEFVAFESKLLSDVYSHPGCQITISMESLLITPIQRIPRYLLLIREILKLLEKLPAAEVKKSKLQGTAKQELDKALLDLQEAAKLVNDSFKKREQRAQVVAIDQRLRGLDKCLLEGLTDVTSERKNGKASLVHASRFLIKMGMLQKKSKGMVTVSYKQRFVLLFNDILVYTAPTKAEGDETSSLKVKQIIWLKDVQAFIPDRGKKAAKDQSANDFHFQVVHTHTSNSEKQTITWKTNSEAEREQWIDVITRAHLVTSKTHQDKEARRAGCSFAPGSQTGSPSAVSREDSSGQLTLGRDLTKGKRLATSETAP